MRAPVLTLKRARALRRKMTLPEVVLWQGLRGSRLKDCRFRRQHPVGPYILDFYCSALQLAIEIDGAVHESAVQARHDAHRDRWLGERGITVLRDDKLEALLETIEQAVAPSTAFGGPPPP